ncbi:MAG: DUF58 domain-containing protein [Myxococcota bacterium]|nr:DUF58 domain-containing protein [Myxococcota bacterium]
MRGARVQSVIERAISPLGRLIGRRPKLRNSSLGRWSIGLVFTVGLAALTSGNNLLILVFSGLLSLLLLSGLFSSKTLSGLRLSCDPLSLAWAKEMHAVTGSKSALPFTVKNKKRWLPSLTLTFQGLQGEALLPGSRGLQRLKVNQASLPLLSPGEARVIHFSPTLERGCLLIDGLWVESAAPFGFFIKSLYLSTTQLVFLAPPPVRIERDLSGVVHQNGAPHDRSRPRGEPTRSIGGGEPEGLRAFSGVEPIASIHWKSSARHGELLVIEREVDQPRAAPQHRVLWPEAEDEVALTLLLGLALAWLDGDPESEREERTLWVPLRLLWREDAGFVRLIDQLKKNGAGSDGELLLRDLNRAVEASDASRLEWSLIKRSSWRHFAFLSALFPCAPVWRSAEERLQLTTAPLPMTLPQQSEVMIDPLISLPPSLAQLSRASRPTQETESSLS